ncbi:MAG: hypothetical protein Q9193_003125, partial [Seirophora villosa]
MQTSSYNKYETQNKTTQGTETAMVDLRNVESSLFMLIEDDIFSVKFDMKARSPRGGSLRCLDDKTYTGLDR